MENVKHDALVALSTGEVLVDLTKDDVTADKVDAGIWFHDKTGFRQQGTSTKTVDASKATATAADVPIGLTFGRGDELATGTMPDFQSKDIEVSTTDGTAIPHGRHDGTGKAKLAESELAKLIPSNIKQGVSLFGVEGDFGADDISAQSKTVIPTFEKQTINPDEGFAFLSSVEVEAIKVTRTDNEWGGTSVVIG